MAKVVLEKLSVERARLALDRHRFELEKERLISDRKMKLWTIFSILIPVILAIGTIFFNIWSQSEQSKREFALRTAEIVASSGTPSEARARMNALSDIFPNYFPTKVRAALDAFDPKKFTDPSPSYSAKMEFLNFLFQNYSRKDEALRIYDGLFANGLTKTVQK